MPPARATRLLLALALALPGASGAACAQDAAPPTPDGERVASARATGDSAIAAAPAVPALDAPAATSDGVPAPVDLFEAALELARRDHPELDADAARTHLARLVALWRARVGDDPSPAVRARAFADVLFVDERFVAVDAVDDPEALHVDSVLRERRGYCLSLAVVALSMAQRLDEPLFAVALPNHVLVRWDDGSTRIALELLRGGEVVSDDALRDSLGGLWRADSFYLRDLRPREVAALLVHNRGFTELARGDLDAAEADLRRAVRELPELPEAHRNLGVLLGERRRFDEAIAECSRALQLFPGDLDALLNLALCEHASGDAAAALDDLDVLLLLDPSHARGRELELAWRAGAAGAARPLDDPPDGLRPGLRGTYFAGTAFERERRTQVDADLDFDWKRDAPAPGVPADRFSARWTGWLRVPTTATYTFFVVANDGVRIRVGDASVVDHWQDAGYTSWTGAGDAHLVAGFHPITVEFYDESDNARLVVLLGADDRERPLPLRELLFHEDGKR
ncbi:MAG: tetratricopeptide repeat protein [Planctomycetes bacterium]|nr:tetratricopeptide repeat protein [Planctomycetota bacterium]